MIAAGLSKNIKFMIIVVQHFLDRPLFHEASGLDQLLQCAF